MRSSSGRIAPVSRGTPCASAKRVTFGWGSTSASRSEKQRALPGDELIADPIASLTHAISIQGTPGNVWPWLAQMGAGARAGWYSYDFIDNGRKPSRTSIAPHLQAIGVGTLFPATPRATDGFHVLMLEAAHHLVLGWKPKADGPLMVTWAFVLDRQSETGTRLIVRARANRRYPLYGLPPSVGLAAIRAGHFIMQRKQLLGIRGRVESAPGADRADLMLNEFMPVYDIVERHAIRVRATPQVTLETALATRLERSAIIRAIIRARELMLGARTRQQRRPEPLLDQMQSLGWRVLAEQPGREILVGAVTQPWHAEVTFRGLGPDQFRTFAEPDFVKIAWTLRADPAGPGASVLRTETRVVTSDHDTRARFRRYWARFSPGIRLIRHILLRQVRKEAEQRA